MLVLFNNYFFHEPKGFTIFNRNEYHNTKSYVCTFNRVILKGGRKGLRRIFNMCPRVPEKKRGRIGLRQILNTCTRRLDPQVPEKESTDVGTVNATAIEEKAQKGQTAKENEVKNAVSAEL